MQDTSRNVPQSSVARIAVAGQDIEQVLGHVPGALLDQFVVGCFGLVALGIVLAQERADDADKVCHWLLLTFTSCVWVVKEGLGSG